MKPATIDQVIEKLESIVQWSKENSSRAGFFASLYLRVTQTIKSKLGTGFFEDDKRLERLDVIFANRYFDAYEQYRNNDPEIPKAWAVAFHAVDNAELIIVQHLLLGISAHINIDLGVAAARTSPGEQIEGLKSDFNKVNDVLATLVPTGLSEISKLSPLLHLLEDVAQKEEEVVINFSIKVARDFSWMLATQLAPLTILEQEPIIDQKNTVIAGLGEKLVSPGFLIESIIQTIHSVEVKNVVQIIDTLNAGNELVNLIGKGEEVVLSEEELKKAPNYKFYSKIIEGTWQGNLDMKLSSWSNLFPSSIGLKNKILISKMRIFQLIFGKPTILHTVKFAEHEGRAGTSHIDTKISKGWFTLARSKEKHILAPNGRSVSIDANIHYGILPFLFNEHNVYPGTIYDEGTKGLFQIDLLGTTFAGNIEVEENGTQLRKTIKNEWLSAEEVMKKG